MTERYDVVVVGGGVVGCAALYELARAGISDTLLIERRQLTSGSSWHAAGNVTQFGHYAEITGLYVDSIRTYLAAEAESGHSAGFHEAGSLRLAATKEELRAYERLIPSYEKMGVPYAVIGPDEIRKVHPLLVLDGVLGAAHTPTDGHVDASGATYALAKAAQARGAKIALERPVVALRQGGPGWIVETEKGPVEAERVVLATSFWTRGLTAPLGLAPPLFALEHHEVVTGPSAALAALDFEVPTVRDPVAPSNTRQERDGYLCGVYEATPKPWRPEGPPLDFAEELLPPDLDRLLPHLERVMERLPDFGEAGIKVMNNGPLCYTPDALPMVGPVSSHPGLWFCTGFNVGFGTGGGAAKYLAGWMARGAPERPLPIIHADRFADPPSAQAALDAITAIYAAGYATPASGPAR